MYDITLLQVNKCLYDLRNHNFCLGFPKILLPSQSLKEIPAGTVLKDGVYVLLVVEVAVKSDYVGVLQSPLNLEFLFHLGKKIKLFQRRLHNYFQSNGLLAVLFYCSEDFAKLARANRLYVIEVLHCPSLFFLSC